MKTKITPLRCLLATFCCLSAVYFIMLCFLDEIKEPGNQNELHQLDEISPFPDDSFRHIHWFVQVSMYRAV